MRRPTIFESRYGNPPSVEELVQLWNVDLTNKLLNTVWEAYDILYENLAARIPWNMNYDDLERSITEALVDAIQESMDGFLPLKISHSPFERESRSKPPAIPPAYDLAFKWNADTRIMWPLEAKVLKTDRDTVENLGDYVQTLQNRYLTCKYAPFSNGGAMVSYLKSGNADTLLNNIEALIGCSMQPYLTFPNRQHRTSDHYRTP